MSINSKNVGSNTDSRRYTIQRSVFRIHAKYQGSTGFEIWILLILLFMELVVSMSFESRIIQYIYFWDVLMYTCYQLKRNKYRGNILAIKCLLTEVICSKIRSSCQLRSKMHLYFPHLCGTPKCKISVTEVSFLLSAGNLYFM